MVIKFYVRYSTAERSRLLWKLLLTPRLQAQPGVTSNQIDNDKNPSSVKGELALAQTQKYRSWFSLVINARRKGSPYREVCFWPIGLPLITRHSWPSKWGTFNRRNRPKAELNFAWWRYGDRGSTLREIYSLMTFNTRIEFNQDYRRIV